jgi:hypothetical protein
MSASTLLSLLPRSLSPPHPLLLHPTARAPPPLLSLPPGGRRSSWRSRAPGAAAAELPPARTPLLGSSPSRGGAHRRGQVRPPPRRIRLSLLSPAAGQWKPATDPGEFVAQLPKRGRTRLRRRRPRPTRGGDLGWRRSRGSPVVAPHPYRAAQVVDDAGASWGGGVLDPGGRSDGALDPSGCATWWSSATAGHGRFPNSGTG